MLLSWWNYKVNKNYFTLGEMIFWLKKPRQFWGQAKLQRRDNEK